MSSDSWFWYFTWACKVSKPFKKPGKRQICRPTVHYMYIHIYFTACTYSLFHTYILIQNVHTYCTSRTFSLWTAVQPGLGPWLLVSENSRRHVGSLGFPGTGQRRVFQKNSSPLQGIPKVSMCCRWTLKIVSTRVDPHRKQLKTFFKICMAADVYESIGCNC